MSSVFNFGQRTCALCVINIHKSKKNRILLHYFALGLGLRFVEGL